MFQIVSLLELCNPFVKKLDIKQLLPNDKGPPTIEEEETERFEELFTPTLYHKVNRLIGSITY